MSRSTPLAQGDIEAGILRAIEEMELLTEEFAEACDAEAHAENAYKRLKWSLVVNPPDDGEKRTVPQRDALAETLCVPEAEAYRLAAARLRSLKEALSTKRARLDALRSLSANVRAQT